MVVVVQLGIFTESALKMGEFYNMLIFLKKSVKQLNRHNLVNSRSNEWGDQVRPLWGGGLNLNWGLSDKQPAMWSSGEEHFRQRDQQASVQRPWDSKKLDLSEEQPGDQCGWEQNEQRGWLEKKWKRWAGPCRPWWRGWIFWVGSYRRILSKGLRWSDFFSEDFFLMWTIFKVFIEFVIISFLFCVLVFYPPGMWDLSSLTRDWTHTP